MKDGITVLERAFELARSGSCRSVSDIKARLKAEGFALAQLTGPTLSRQLLGLMQVAQGKAMPKGPKGQKRPADMIGNAIKVARIATGEEAEDFGADDGKDKAAQSLGQRGGKARADALSAKRRKEIAKRAAAARWKRD